MHDRRLEEVVLDLVFVLYRSDNRCANVPLVIERLELAEDAHIHLLTEFGRCPVYGVAVNVRIGVDPLLGFNGAGPVVELVGVVGSLVGDVADLGDECDL